MSVTILTGDCRAILPTLESQSVQCCVTSPPYWGLRDYGVTGQLGQEKTPDEFVSALVTVFREVRRVLRDDGTVWLNLGDSYNNSDKWGGGHTNTGKHTVADDGSVPSFAVRARKQNPPGLKPKDLIGIPWLVAFALRADGWYLRSDIIWAKPNCMPESVTDRPTRSHEYLFLLTKRERYYYDHEAIKEPCVYDLEKRIGQPNFENHGKNTKELVNGNRSHRKVLENLKKREDKQRGHSRRHDGFNDRWDHMEKEEQCIGTRNKRDVWTVAPANFNGAHFATFPPDLIKPCILAGTKHGDMVLDPFGGSGTTGQVALELGRKATLIELNPEYIPLIEQRTNVTPGLCLP